ncbi:MAG: phosphate/phosphite/phosphonate ABC transporter substrate-binding protein [Acidimicrobiia bacterium]|nr:phosphate/phosphite/phosphonate ABC transporter substrate-binding protein [Acidimicrobiia bacterium]
MKARTWATMSVVLALVLTACGGADTADTTTAAPETTTTTKAETTTTMAPTTTTEAMSTVGTPENPIKVLFVPSAEAAIIVTGGELMAQALNEATGLTYEVVVPTDYSTTIEEMCASPDNTMGFIPGAAYVEASALCGVDVSFKAVRFGWGVYWAQILVPRDSDLMTIEDLEGKSWAYPDSGSTSGFQVPSLMFSEAGVTPGEQIEAGGHTQAALAVYNGDVDFATTFFSPPLLPDGNWDETMSPELPDDVIATCGPNEDGSKLVCGTDGEYRVLDARASARTDAPDIMQKVRILGISPGIPNDTLSFGPEFPADLRAEIEAALVAFSGTDAWNESIGNQDFYGWTGIEPAVDSEYDGLRKIQALLADQ